MKLFTVVLDLPSVKLYVTREGNWSPDFSHAATFDDPMRAESYAQYVGKRLLPGTAVPSVQEL